MLTNLALHITPSLLLLLALSRLTARFWPSAFVASVYALHPLQVETVAWASARSEALAGVFFAAALVAWASWLEKPGAARYAAVLAAVTLGTLAGPGFAALPFVLLLLDVWPLGRIGVGGERSGRFADRPAPAPMKLLLEKAPLLLIGVAGALAHRASAAAMANPWSADPSLGTRLALVPVQLVEAAARVLWPTDLAFTHPNSLQMGLGAPPGWQVLGALVLIVLPLVAFARMGERGRPLLVGWAWFLVLALPSAGLWPSGLRMLHDRDLQLALVGVALMAAFAATSVLPRLTRPEIVASLLAGLVLVPLAATARVQTEVWRDSDALFDHALAVHERDSMAHYYKGILLIERGFDSAGIHQLQSALEISPELAHANLMLGAVMMDRASPGEAVVYLRRAAAGMPHSLDARIRLAEALAAEGDTAAAFAAIDEAAAIDPGSGQPFLVRGRLHEALGSVDEAIEAYRRAVELDASQGVARARLGSLERARARAVSNREGAPALPEGEHGQAD